MLVWIWASLEALEARVKVLGFDPTSSVFPGVLVIVALGIL